MVHTEFVLRVLVPVFVKLDTQDQRKLILNFILKNLNNKVLFSLDVVHWLNLVSQTHALEVVKLKNFIFFICYFNKTWNITGACLNLNSTYQCLCFGNWTGNKIINFFNFVKIIIFSLQESIVTQRWSIASQVFVKTEVLAWSQLVLKALYVSAYQTFMVFFAKSLCVIISYVNQMVDNIIYHSEIVIL